MKQCPVVNIERGLTYFLVRVQAVGDDIKQLSRLCLERKGAGVAAHRRLGLLRRRLLTTKHPVLKGKEGEIVARLLQHSELQSSNVR